MRNAIKVFLFFIVLVAIATGVHVVWTSVLRPRGFGEYLSPQELEIINRTVFCGYFALFAGLCAFRAVVCWMGGKPGYALVALLVALACVGVGVLFFLHADRFGLGTLAFGVPMLLGIALCFLGQFRRRL